jgi:hypothetical protein
MAYRARMEEKNSYQMVHTHKHGIYHHLVVILLLLLV